jgi:peptide/nickel transport system substrate-binding protein
MFAAILSGCGQPAAKAPATPAAPAGDTLTIATPYSIETFDPTKYSSDGDMYILSQVMEPLVSVDGNLTVPRLAESWETPNDLTWVFKLRKGMYWHDGNDVYPKGTKKEVTATDAKYSLDFVLDPANKSRLQSTYAEVISKVEVVDPYTLKITTKQPYAFLLTDISRTPVFSKEVRDKLGPDKFAKLPIGCGPFKFVEYKVDDRVVLERNDNFFIKPKIAKVIFRIIPDKSVALMALEAGEVDIALQIPASEVARLTKENKVKVVPNNFGWYRYAAFNFNVPLFKDLKVREAIASAINMNEITKTIFADPGLAEPAWGPVPKGLPGWSDKWKSMWEYNPDKAKKALADLGWKPGKDGILEKAGKKLSFNLKVHNDPFRQKMATLIATQLKAVGIDAQLQVTDWATLLDNIRKGNTEMFVMGGGSTVDGLLYMFHSVNAAGQAHNTFYKNAALDKLLDQAKATTDEKKREALWTQAAEIVIKDRVHLGGYLEYVQIGLSKRVQEFDPPTPWTSLTNAKRNVGLAPKS